MFKTIVVDDDLIASSLINFCCDENSFVSLEASFNNPKDAIIYLKSHHIDLMIIDIEMPEITGLELLDRISQTPYVIFVTGHEKYAIKAFEHHVIDYILKPFTKERFDQAIDKLAFLKIDTEDDFIAIRHDRKLSKVFLMDIYYIEAYGDYVKIHLKENKFLVTNITLKKIKEGLGDDFIQTHRKFITNKKYIKSFNNSSIFLSDDRELSIGKSYTEVIQGMFEKD